jgi:hypothetical protein
MKRESKFYIDVKSPIVAGMEFTYPGTQKTKLREIGFDVVRIYFDSPDKDWVIGQKRLKRVFK